jgi:hypothetical protein
MAFEVGISSFSFPNGTATPDINNDGSPSSNLSPDSPWFAWVYADTPGYYVTEAVTTPFTGSVQASDILAPSDFQAGTNPTAACRASDGSDDLTPFTSDAANDGLSTALQVISVTCASSGWNYQNSNGTPTPGVSSGFPTPYDSFSEQGWGFVSSALTTGGNAPAQTYNGAVTLALWS